MRARLKEKTDHRKMKIVIASGVRGDTRRYRTIHLAEQCRLAGLDATLSHVMAPEFRRIAARADLLIIHRVPFDRNVEAALRTVHGQGGKVLFDTDDLLFDPEAFQWIDSPDFKDPLRASLYLEDMHRLRQTMEHSDGILVSTNYLAQQATGMGLPVYVHRNGFSLEMLAISERVQPASPSTREKVVIGYASGTPTHNRDFASISQPLRKLLDQHTELSLWVIGPLKLGPEWQTYPKQRMLRLPHVPWKLLPGYLARFDINLAPLIRDNPFARSKSEIKWMEAALVKVPTLATPSDAFRETINDGQDGYLADTPSEWEQALGKLIVERAQANAVGQEAFKRVTREYHPLTRAQTLIPILNQVMPGADLIPPVRFEAIPDGTPISEPSLYQMAAYSLRTRGPGVLLRQIRVYLRRMISPVFPYRDGTKRRREK